LANTATCGAAGIFSVATSTAGAMPVVVVTLTVCSKVVGELATGAAGTTGTGTAAIGKGGIRGNTSAKLVAVVLDGDVELDEDEGVVGEGTEVVVVDVEVDDVLVDVVVEVDDVLVDVLVEVDVVEVDVEVEEEEEEDEDEEEEEEDEDEDEDEDDDWSRAQIVRSISWKNTPT
jgi:hypothetical protein